MNNPYPNLPPPEWQSPPQQDPAIYGILREMGFRLRPSIHASPLQWLLLSLPLGAIWAGTMALLPWARQLHWSILPMGIIYSLLWTLFQWAYWSWKRKKSGIPPWSAPPDK